MKYALKTNTKLGDKAPEKINIFPVGEVRIIGADSVLMDELAARNIIETINASDADMVIDYEHQTMYGGEAPAAGWLNKDGFKWDEKTGFWGTCTWTEKAKKYIESREYRYFSPVFSADRATKRIMRLHNVALTNQPRMQNITALVAKDEFADKENTDMKELRKRLGLDSEMTDKEVMAKALEVIDSKPDVEAIVAKAIEGSNTDTAKIIESLETIIAKNGMMAIRKRIKADDKMPDALVEQQVIRMLDELDKLRKKTAAKDVLDVLELKEDATEAEILAKVHLLKQKPDLTEEFQALKAQFDELQVEKEKRETADLIQDALTKRKITPAMANDPESWACKLAAENPSSFKMYVEQALEIIPAKEDIQVKKPETANVADDIAFAEKAGLGLTKEDFEKYGGE